MIYRNLTKLEKTMEKKILDYKPYIINMDNDWVNNLNLEITQNIYKNPKRLNVLILYGSLRKTSYSKLLAYEYGRILDKLGADVRIFNPENLPIKDDVSENNEKVIELRDLCNWSEAQVWVSPEQHGNITAVFKNQIDWIPLSLGSVRPTQGKILAVSQVNGGSQSFNAVNNLRILGRWMRMFTIPNQSSVPKAWTEFDNNGRMKPSSYRNRVVDVAEELYKMSIILRPNKEMLVDRYSERLEKEEHGRLLSQKEKETSKDKK